MIAPLPVHLGLRADAAGPQLIGPGRRRRAHGSRSWRGYSSHANSATAEEYCIMIELGAATMRPATKEIQRWMSRQMVWHKIPSKNKRPTQ